MKHKDSVIVLYIAFKVILMGLDVNMTVKGERLNQSVNNTEPNKTNQKPKIKNSIIRTGTKKDRILKTETLNAITLISVGIL